MIQNKLFNILEQFTLSRDALAKLTGTTRDLDDACGYPPDLTIQDFRKYFDREGVCTRIVEVMPEECWSVQPEVYETESKDETEFEKAWSALEDEHSIYEYLNRLDIVSGIGRYGILILGIDDGLTLDKPANQGKMNPGMTVTNKSTGASTTRKLLYLKPVDESLITINKYEIDVTSPRYGKPVEYQVKFENPNGTESAELKTVHYTRVLHVADNRLTSDTYGVPRMQKVYNYLYNLKKIGGGSGEMFWRGGFPGIAFKIDPNRTDALTDTEKTDLRAEMQKYSDGLQRYFAVANMEAQSLAPQVADPMGHAMLQIKLVSIALGVPYRIFMGSEEAKLASSQDVKAWNRRVAKRQNMYLTKRVIRPFVKLLVTLGVLPEPSELNVYWSDLGSLDELQQAQVATAKTDALAKYAMGGVEAIVGPEEYLTLIGGYTPDEAETMLKSAIEKVEPPVLEEPAPAKNKKQVTNKKVKKLKQDDTNNKQDKTNE